ncbi:basic proline-rich protein-like isoform X2 [Parus major]|uniref:basic proline-rich protein-like isoform X2 n=1 Tax=Parus major TaxID=9157 RepID=UPI0007714A12|nr:basic proline-rich protein-like isoform X2 [Parus major]
MSHHPGALGVPLHRPLPIPTRSKSKRLRTKRERNAAKFGPKLPLRGSRQGPTGPPRWLQPPLWGGLALGSPLGPPKPVVITQKRLCHRGLFNHEVKSLDVRRLLTPAPGGDGPPPAPQIEEGEVGGVKDLVASLASLLGSFRVFGGRELVSERRRSLLAVLRRHRRGPPDLGVFLAHRTPAQPPGLGTPRGPRQEGRPRPPGRAVSLAGWKMGDPPARTPSPLRAVNTPPPRAPSPIFEALKEQEVSLEFWGVVPPLFLGVSRGGLLTPPPHPQNPFSWSSAEDEEDETPGGLTQAWGGPGGLLPAAPPFWRSPQPPQAEEAAGGDEGWTPIALRALSPDPPPWGPSRSRDTHGPPRAPRPPRAPKTWRTEKPWDPPDPSRLPWELPDPSPPPPTPPRPSRAPQIWSPEPRKASQAALRPLWDPPNPSRLPWDPRPWSPELPRAAQDHPRPPWAPQLWNSEPSRALLDGPRPLWDPPRPHWDPADAPRPLWDSADPPRAHPDPPRPPRLWSPELPWDPPAPPKPPRDALRPSRDPGAWSPEPPGVPQDAEPSRCCCRRLCRDMTRRDPPCRDTSHGAPRRPAPLCPYLLQPKRPRPGWGGGWGAAWGGPRDSPPSPFLLPVCGCPCSGLCRGGAWR